VVALDHRSDQRLDFALQVEIENHGLIHCTTFDLGEGGCFLVTDETFTLGEPLVLQVHLPSEPVAVEGTVVWLSDGTRRPRGAGVRFTKTPGKLVDKLREIRER
jgi:Tfp pilus assembly protein PilZ